MTRTMLTSAGLGCLAVLAAGCASAPTPVERGLAYYREGQYLFAADEFTEGARQNPASVAAYVNRGVTRVRLGDLSGAIEDYNHAIELDPNDPAIYFNRGNALVAAGQYEPAIDDFSRAVVLSPVFARAWFNRGGARVLAGQTEAGLQDWLHAIELEGDPWARAAMRRSAGLEPGTAATTSPSAVVSVAPPPSPGMATAGVPLPPSATSAATPPPSPAASPEMVDARTLAIRALSRELDGDHEGAMRDLRAALAVEQDPARRQSLETLLRRLDTPR
jgi:tetratricopeptide (TPR) repeat protein